LWHKASNPHFIRGSPRTLNKRTYDTKQTLFTKIKIRLEYFNENRRFIILFAKANQWKLHLTRRIKSITLHPLSLRLCSILPSHLRQGLPRNFCVYVSRLKYYLHFSFLTYMMLYARILLVGYHGIQPAGLWPSAGHHVVLRGPWPHWLIIYTLHGLRSNLDGKVYYLLWLLHVRPANQRTTMAVSLSPLLPKKCWCLWLK